MARKRYDARQAQALREDYRAWLEKEGRQHSREMASIYAMRAALRQGGAASHGCSEAEICEILGGDYYYTR